MEFFSHKGKYNLLGQKPPLSHDTNLHTHLSLSLYLSISFSSLLLLFVLMETSTAGVDAAAPAGTPGNHSLKHQHSHSHLPSQHHASLSSSAIRIIIISGISLIIVLLLILLIVVMLRRLKSAQNRTSGFKDNNGCINNTSCKFIAHTTITFTSSPADVKGGCLYGSNLGHKSPRKYEGVQVFTYKELEVATDRFSEANVIGNGGSGVVYRGILADGTVAAVKMLRREGRQGERAFRIEVDLLSRLHSPYLVELLGYCADQHHRLLIFEFMSNGTLQNHLHHRQYQPLDWGTRLRIALDCARALEFLHEHTVPPVIHRDFKCSNILLDQNFRAKVSDFGLAKMGSEKINGQTSSTSVLGTTGYLAPESASTGKLTTKSDVYSYGVVLLQILTGRVPVDTKRPPGEHVLVSWALPRLTNREKVVEMVDPALRGLYSKKDLIQVAAIAAMCVQPEADYRPLMTDVVQSLIPLVKNLSSISSSASSRFQN
ncbi:probable serine/threonine-protein kinase PBL7 [Manihot esculenta]|uniref:probable serine/threonine-protein kinase PBL7 n=1 Tax=Manihot esculenta TaxID=3983 RepID=UPI000B5D86A3|nr:probable serine/threonine-protein kinase PBL7 [Manihot esculenta]